MFAHSQSRNKTTDAYVLSTTVIAERALEAGVFATALMLDGSMRLPDEVQTIVVDKNLLIFSNMQSS